MSEQETSARKWRVIVIEWLSHVAVIEAGTPEEAQAIAQKLWITNEEHEAFRFTDSCLDGIVVDDA